MLKKKILLLMLAENEISSEDQEYHRYSKSFFSLIEDFTEQQFVDSFRMNRTQFDFLFIKVLEEYPKIEKLKKKLKIFIYFIAHLKTYRELKDVFDISYAKLFRIINEMIYKICAMAHKYILFPEHDEFEILKEGFYRRGRFENVILAMDGTEFVRTKPEENPFSYYNRKSVFSVKFVCLTDYKLRFKGITYGYGASHDSRVYRISAMKNQVDALENYYVVADSAFQNFDNVIPTISTINNPLSEESINQLTLQRITVENAFGLFKNKFKRFSNRTFKTEIKKYISSIKEAMFIHNFIIDN